MMKWWKLLRQNWSDVLEDKWYVLRFLLNLVVCYSIYISVTKLLVANRFREGVVLHDPIQQFFKPVDLSLPIFIITYVAIVVYILYVAARPQYFSYAARAFLAVFLLRFSFIWLVPLTPPHSYIALNDPVLDWIVGNNHEISNDLFFSGHISDISIFFFCCGTRWLRVFFLCSIISIGLMMVWQHVHYTADVVAAPFFAYASYVIFTKQKNYLR